MKTADILYTLDESGIGIDHDGGAAEYCAYWPKEGKGGIVVQSKPEDLIKNVIHSFQAMYLAHSKRIKEYSEKDKEIERLKKELSEFKGVVKQMVDKRKELNAPLYISESNKISDQLYLLEKEVDTILSKP